MIITREEFKKMTLEERQELFESDPELFMKLTNGPENPEELTIEDFLKMSLDELSILFNENPNKYNELLEQQKQYSEGKKEFIKDQTTYKRIFKEKGIFKYYHDFIKEYQNNIPIMMDYDYFKLVIDQEIRNGEREHLKQLTLKELFNNLEIIFKANKGIVI